MVYKKLLFLLGVACVVLPVNSMESNKSISLKETVTFGSGLVAGALLVYCAWVRPQQKKIETLKEKDKFFKKSLTDGFVYFNRTPENLNKVLEQCGLNTYQAEVAKFQLNSHTCNLFSVIKKVDDIQKK